MREGLKDHVNHLDLKLLVRQGTRGGGPTRGLPAAQGPPSHWIPRPHPPSCRQTRCLTQVPAVPGLGVDSFQFSHSCGAR